MLRIALLTLSLAAAAACAQPHISGLTALNGRLILNTGAGDKKQVIYTCEVAADNSRANCVPMQMHFD